MYNFCVAVDDADMSITEVVRAEEHRNTLRQVLIYNALDRAASSRTARSSWRRTGAS